MADARAALLALDWGWLAGFTRDAPLTRARLVRRFRTDAGDVDLSLLDPQQPGRRLVQQIGFDSGTKGCCESRDAARFHLHARRLLIGAQRAQFDAVCAATFSPVPDAQAAAARLLAHHDPIAARIPAAAFPRVIAPSAAPRVHAAVVEWRHGWSWLLADHEASIWAAVDADYAALRSGRRGPWRSLDTIDSALLSWERALKRLVRDDLGGVIVPVWSDMAYRLGDTSQGGGYGDGG